MASGESEDCSPVLLSDLTNVYFQYQGQKFSRIRFNQIQQEAAMNFRDFDPNDPLLDGTAVLESDSSDDNDGAQDGDGEGDAHNASETDTVKDDQESPEAAKDDPTSSTPVTVPTKPPDIPEKIVEETTQTGQTVMKKETPKASPGLLERGKNAILNAIGKETPSSTVAERGRQKTTKKTGLRSSSLGAGAKRLFGQKTEQPGETSPADGRGREAQVASANDLLLFDNNLAAAPTQLPADQNTEQLCLRLLKDMKRSNEEKIEKMQKEFDERQKILEEGKRLLEENAKKLQQQQPEKQFSVLGDLVFWRSLIPDPQVQGKYPRKRTQWTRDMRQRVSDYEIFLQNAEDKWRCSDKFVRAYTNLSEKLREKPFKELSRDQAKHRSKLYMKVKKLTKEALSKDREVFEPSVAALTHDKEVFNVITRWRKKVRDMADRAKEEHGILEEFMELLDKQEADQRAHEEQLSESEEEYRKFERQHILNIEKSMPKFPREQEQDQLHKDINQSIEWLASQGYEMVKNPSRSQTMRTTSRSRSRSRRRSYSSSSSGSASSWESLHRKDSKKLGARPKIGRPSTSWADEGLDMANTKLMASVLRMANRLPARCEPFTPGDNGAKGHKVLKTFKEQFQYCYPSAEYTERQQWCELLRLCQGDSARCLKYMDWKENIVAEVWRSLEEAFPHMEDVRKAVTNFRALPGITRVTDVPGLTKNNQELAGLIRAHENSGVAPNLTTMDMITQKFPRMLVASFDEKVTNGKALPNDLEAFQKHVLKKIKTETLTQSRKEAQEGSSANNQQQPQNNQGKSQQGQAPQGADRKSNSQKRKERKKRKEGTASGLAAETASANKASTNEQSGGQKKSGDKSAPRKPYVCVLCKEEHSLNACPEYPKKSWQERWDLVKPQGHCYRCLEPGHMATQCKDNSRLCNKKCAKAHHKLLHKEGST